MCIRDRYITGELENNPNTKYIYKLLKIAKKKNYAPQSIYHIFENIFEFDKEVHSAAFKKILKNSKEYVGDQYYITENTEKLVKELKDFEKNIDWLEK